MGGGLTDAEHYRKEKSHLIWQKTIWGPADSGVHWLLLPLEFLILLEAGWEENSPRVRNLTGEENKRLVRQKWMIRQSTQIRRRSGVLKQKKTRRRTRKGRESSHSEIMFNAKKSGLESLCPLFSTTLLLCCFSAVKKIIFYFKKSGPVARNHILTLAVMPQDL